LPGWHGLLELDPGPETSRANGSEHRVAALAVKATSRVLDRIGGVAGQQALRDLVEGIRVPRCTQVGAPRRDGAERPPLSGTTAVTCPGRAIYLAPKKNSLSRKFPLTEMYGDCN